MAQFNSHDALVNKTPLHDSLIISGNEFKDSSTLQITKQITVNKDTRAFISPLIPTWSDCILFPDSIPAPIKNSTVQVIRGEKGIKIASYNSDWMAGVLLFALILLAVLRFSFSKFLFRVFDSMINYQTSSNLFLEKNMRNLRGSIFLNLLFYVNLALFIVQYFVYILSLNKTHNNIVFFLYCFAGLVTLYSSKLIFIRFIGYVFNGIKESKEYLHTVSIYNKNLGVILLPITLSVPYMAQHATPLLLNGGLILTLIFYVFRLIRGVKILFRQHVSIFYMILYLCALEILPLLMIYKLLYLLV
ncbi:DUF4271 domain-containing protein [Labilibaculum antarcticum]|uniref:DUF4271 domain-containing protein n=1 Tax=Labilibaculum antarcticum TaxID=1717717 RepID=UPI000BBAEF84|nr:DUF4271 domain-containing protein [Labilibaculum antarcticum]